jgi:filamentous hemagglutinin family protein
MAIDNLCRPMKLGFFQRTCITIGSVIIFTGNCTLAQIAPDGTLLNNSQIRLQDNIRFIEGGTQAGSNLFHSFQEFSIPINSTGYFNNSVDIQNIIARVTGGSVSNIDGLIRANGSANLFLINPSGIILGQNASLSIGGSFVGTTANALQFGKLGNFSATNPEIPSPLLTINPDALLFNQINTASIQNNSIAPAGKHLGGFETFGLRVPDGKSLLLIGGNININGGQLNAYGGRIELGGLTSFGNINLKVDGNNLSLIYPEKVPQADVSLKNGAIANVAYSSGGSIAINARNINIFQSSLNAGIEQNLGFTNNRAGDITLNATEGIKVEQASRINNRVNFNGTGDAGNINITTGSLSVKDDARIITSSLGRGNAGNLIIEAGNHVSFMNGGFGETTLEKTGVGRGGDLQIQAGSVSVENNSRLIASTLGQGNSGNLKIDARDNVELKNDSFVFSQVQEGVGNGGEISISAGSVSLINGSLLSASTLGKGNAGNLSIKARESVSFAGDSKAFSNVEGSGIGNGNNLSIEAKSVLVSSGSFLTASTLGKGNAGNVIIDATDFVRFDGGIATSSVGLEGFFNALGDGGIIRISAGSLQLLNGSKLITNSYGKEGNAGSINLIARDTVSLSGESYIFSQLGGQIKGKAGEINISTGSLSLAGRSALDSSTFGFGDGGNINIEARGNVSFVTEGGAYSRVQLGAEGKGGNIDITSGSLTVSDGSFLAASTLGRGDSGNVTINAADLASISGENQKSFPGGIYSEVATANAGNGGKININTRSLVVKNGARLATSTNGRGNANTINIQATDSVLFDGVGNNQKNRSGAYSLVFPEGIGKADNININTGSLSLTNGALLTAGTEGQGNAGKVVINAKNTVSIDGISNNGLPSSVSSTVAKNALGDGGDIDITTETLRVINGAELSSSSQSSRNAGNLKVNASSIYLNNLGNITADTTAGQGNINLNVKDSLVQLRSSKITANATGKNIIAGNINIDAGVIAVLENSSISANSVDSRGGQVFIKTESIFGTQPWYPPTLGGSITARGATRELNGTVQINAPEVDPTKGILELPVDVLNAIGLINENFCARAYNSSFIITGRGGIAPSPFDVFTGETTWEDWRVNPIARKIGEAEKVHPRDNKKPLPESPIIEAQGWIINNKGQVELVAFTQNVTPHLLQNSPNGCLPLIAN